MIGHLKMFDLLSSGHTVTHRYPAKFLPNVVKKLIENYANKDGIIADLFAGCWYNIGGSKGSWYCICRDRY